MEGEEMRFIKKLTAAVKAVIAKIMRIDLVGGLKSAGRMMINLATSIVSAVWNVLKTIFFIIMLPLILVVWLAVFLYRIIRVIAIAVTVFVRWIWVGLATGYRFVVGLICRFMDRLMTSGNMLLVALGLLIKIAAVIAYTAIVLKVILWDPEMTLKVVGVILGLAAVGVVLFILYAGLAIITENGRRQNP
jgi:hypothetical protein